MAPPATRETLRAQAEALGIVLSARCKAEDYTAALDAYARGWQAGAEKSYHEGVKAGQVLATEEDWRPRDWADAAAKLGHAEARQKFPAMFDEFRRKERETQRLAKQAR
jgi:hypothetical protein